MTGHEVHVKVRRTVSNPWVPTWNHFVPGCSCGWSGLVYANYADASADADLHEREHAGDACG